jgi:hypothetical protein
MSDSGVDLGQARDCAGHHDAALPERRVLAIEIRYCVSSGQRRKSIGTGMPGGETLRRMRQFISLDLDLGSRSCETGIEIVRGREATLARQHACLQAVQPDAIGANNADTSNDDGFLDISHRN